MFGHSELTRFRTQKSIAHQICSNRIKVQRFVMTKQPLVTPTWGGATALKISLKKYGKVVVVVMRTGQMQILRPHGTFESAPTARQHSKMIKYFLIYLQYFLIVP